MSTPGISIALRFASDEQRRFPRIRTALTIILFIAAGAFVSGPGRAEDGASRTWTSTDGRTLEAKMVTGSDVAVTLRLSNGQQHQLPLDKLSEADRAYVADALKNAAVEEQRRLGLTDGPYAKHLTGEWEKVTSADGLRFHFFADKNLKAGQQYPLCIYLHGSSNTGSDLEKREPGANGFAAPEVYEDHPSIVIAPEAPAGTGAFKQVAPRISALIDHLEAHLPIDRDRIYVTGYSMGGRGTWALLLADKNRFAAAAPIAGPFESGDRLEALPPVPIWLFYGERDRGEEFRQFAKALQPLNPRFKSTEFPGADHLGVHGKVAKDPAFYEWLFAQKRGS